MKEGAQWLRQGMYCANGKKRIYNFMSSICLEAALRLAFFRQLES